MPVMPFAIMSALIMPRCAGREANNSAPQRAEPDASVRRAGSDITRTVKCDRWSLVMLPYQLKLPAQSTVDDQVATFVLHSQGHCAMF